MDEKKAVVAFLIPKQEIQTIIVYVENDKLN
jgi:hypothetical protein